MEGDNNDYGLKGYDFEPQYSEEDLASINEGIASEEPDSIVSVEEFCVCNNCVVMPSKQENVCCTASDLTVGCLEDRDCITDHSDFDLLVLNPTVLSVAFVQIMAYKGSRGRAPDILNDKQSRLTAYRQFVSWMMKGEKLGKGNRVIIPCCVVNRIRQSFPGPDNSYTGFRSIIDNLSDLFT